MQLEGKETSNVIQEFSRFAHQYDKYSVIQAKVANVLVDKISLSPNQYILDVGCGSGEIYKNLQMNKLPIAKFVAFDSSANMLYLHPQGENVQKICADFNDVDFLKYLPIQKYDLIISSSALQWSTDLDFTMHQLSSLSDIFYGVFFTSGTFKTLHKTAGIISPIYNESYVRKIIEKYYNDAIFSLYYYRLDFDTTRDMFRYIKQSGVSSGERKLSYKQTKVLMKEYPLKYLEFEILVIEART